MYTPTKEELEDMGFEKNHEYYANYFGEIVLIYNTITFEWSAELAKIYPSSRQDIETLIRLFTPNQK